MEPVTISLNTDKQPMFFLPGKLHLTFENPGPTELNPEELSDQERNWINQAYQQGVLFVENPNKGMESKSPAAKKQEIPKEDRKPLEMEEHKFENREAAVAQAKSVLAGKVGAIKKLVASSEDILLLRLMKEAEESSKKRKSIVSALDERLLKLQESLMHSLGGDQGELGTHVTDMTLKNLPELEVEEKIVKGNEFKLDD